MSVALCVNLSMDGFNFATAESLSQKTSPKVSQKAAYQAAKLSLIQGDVGLYHEYVGKYPQSGTTQYLTFYYYLNLIDQPEGVKKQNEMITFLNTHTTRAFYSTLLTKVVQSHQKNKNWQAILKELNEKNANTLALKCILREAYYYTDQKSLAFSGFDELFTDNILPETCNNLTQLAFIDSHIDALDINKKIRFLINKGDIKAAKALNKHPNQTSSHKVYFNYLIQLYENINSLTQLTALLNSKPATLTVTQTDFLKLVEQLAKKDSIAGQALLDLGIRLQWVAKNDTYDIAAKIAVYQSGRSDSIEPLDKINAIPTQYQSDELKQWGFRLSAQKNDWQQSLLFLNHLSEAAKKEATWIYWLGAVHAKLGQIEKARFYFEQIAHETSFYGFLASDQLERPYTVLNNLVKQNKPESVTLTNPNFLMALDLISVDEKGFARAEWQNALKTTDKNQVYAASLRAYSLGENDLGIRAAVNAKKVGGLSGRYPTLYQKELIKNAQMRALDWLMLLSLMRQESLFQPDVKSHANAYGLMQLLIPTANKMSKRLGETTRGILTNPSVNIRYGSEYLFELSEELGRFWPYILSGYNAGPSRVKQWVEAPMDAILWIESIPFKETRHYVKSILENRIIYGYLNQDKNNPVLPKVSNFLTSF